MSESILLKFMNARQKHCASPLDVVSVEWIGGGNVNECFLNAHSRSMDGRYQIISGWLAIPERQSGSLKQFTQHWWNRDRITRRHLDFSPDIEEGAVYIEDNNIASFALLNNQRLSSCVPRSIIFRNGSFYTIELLSGEFRVEKADELTDELLFAPYLIHEIQ